MEAVELVDFCFAYPSALSAGAGEPPAVLAHVDLTVPVGSFTLLCGMTGSGKSTLLQCLKPELAPVGTRSGSVRVLGEVRALGPEPDHGYGHGPELDHGHGHGHEPDPDPDHGHGHDHNPSFVGFVLQDAEAQIVTDTVWHELAFGLENLGIPSNEIHRRVAETASYFGIAGWFEQKTSQLSGGQKQLLNLAAIMVMQPQLLLLDEPTAQLDPLATKEFLATLARVNQELGVTVLVAEHHLEDTLPLCDQVAFIGNRSIAFAGDAQTFIAWCDANTPAFIPALPAATRLALTARQTGIDGDSTLGETQATPYPITVREGRAWLTKRQVDGRLRFAPAGRPLNVGATCGRPSSTTVSQVDRQSQVATTHHPSSVVVSQSDEHEPIDERVPVGGRPSVATTGRPSSTTVSRLDGRLQLAPNDRPSIGDTVVLTTKQLWFGYGRALPSVLRGIDLKVRRGQMHAIVGANGSGKSTLLSVLAGVHKPQRGKVTLQEGLRLATLPQDPKALFSHDTLLQDLMENSRRFNYQRPEAEGMMEAFGLSAYGRRHPYDLSAGEQQKAAFAKLLLVKPDILLLDEPTKGLDAFAKQDLHGFLSRQTEGGNTIVLVSHDLDFVAECAHTCSLLFNGELVGTAPAHEFFAGNLFYTTAIERITQGILPSCVTLRDVLRHE